MPNMKFGIDNVSFSYASSSLLGDSSTYLLHAIRFLCDFSIHPICACIDHFGMN